MAEPKGAWVRSPLQKGLENHRRGNMRQSAERAKKEPRQHPVRRLSRRAQAEGRRSPAQPGPGYRHGGYDCQSHRFRSRAACLNDSAAGERGAGAAANKGKDGKVMNIIISENERGLLFKNGKYVRMLEPGKHFIFGPGHRVERSSTELSFSSKLGNPAALLKNPALAAALATVEVPDEALALHYIDGRFAEALPSGLHAFWAVHHRHEFRMTDIREPMAPESLSPALFSQMRDSLYKRVEVLAYQKGLLVYNGKFVRLLDEGAYYFWNNGIRVEVALVDTRLMQMNIQGQEMLTLDKVALRVNFVCRYRISDFVRVFTEIEDYAEQIRMLAQLALREYIGHSRLDELLESKDQLAGLVLARLKEREAQCFVTFFDAGVKDVILPGEVRDIMNTVLVAEKRAQANVVTRREEVASTRSLLNTAKLMEENPTLLHLKEMECLEKICENVGNLTVNGGDLLGQLAAVLKGGAA